MLSPADMLIIGAAALLFFGPDQLPKVARRAGQIVRDVQSTSHSFIREMERAADESDLRDAARPYAPEPDLVEPMHSAEPDPLDGLQTENETGSLKPASETAKGRDRFA